MYNSNSVEAELLAMSRISSEGFVVFTPVTHDTSADFIVYDKKTSNSYTVQVKSTHKASNRRKNSYIFDVRKPTRKHSKRDEYSFDIYAFVVTSVREVRFEWKSSLPAKSQINFHISDSGKYPWEVNTLSSILYGA